MPVTVEEVSQLLSLHLFSVDFTSLFSCSTKLASCLLLRKNQKTTQVGVRVLKFKKMNLLKESLY